VGPFGKHAYYEWIHPFCDGNGRSGRIILARDLDFDFEEILKYIGDDYLPNIISMTGNIADNKF
jgi:fido (protein-threonine AMPylation protein)